MSNIDDSTDLYPDVVIVLDKALGARVTGKGFYLRVKTTSGAEHIDLDNVFTITGARGLARDKGYDPTHWITVGEGHLIKF